jgi:MEMO1 family protein
MPLVYSAIVPHPPVLMPSVGKDSADQIKTTKNSMDELARELYAASPDTIIIISPHGPIDSKAFTVNITDKYTANFEQFGDFSTKLEFNGDTELLVTEKDRIHNKIPINIISEPELDHGTSIPLYHLTENLKDFKILPIHFSLMDSQTHFEFGKLLKDIILKSSKRIAVIASGDLSHCLTADAPMPFNDAGQEFDSTLIKLLEKTDAQGIVNFDPKLVEQAGECGLRSIIILLGILHNVNYEFKVLGYEAPFGVGYLTAQIIL